jgi:ClpP class serine protease
VGEGRKAAHDVNKGNKDPEDQGKALASDWAEYADGRVLSGKEAQELGFVDQVGTFEDAVKRAEKIAGISKANLVEFQQRFDLSDFFKMFGKTKVPAIKVDLGVEGPKLEAGQMYFILPTAAR